VCAGWSLTSRSVSRKLVPEVRGHAFVGRRLAGVKGDRRVPDVPYMGDIQDGNDLIRWAAETGLIEVEVAAAWPDPAQFLEPTAEEGSVDGPGVDPGVRAVAAGLEGGPPDHRVVAVSIAVLGIHRDDEVWVDVRWLPDGFSGLAAGWRSRR